MNKIDNMGLVQEYHKTSADNKLSISNKLFHSAYKVDLDRCPIVYLWCTHKKNLAWLLKKVMGEVSI